MKRLPTAHARKRIPAWWAQIAPAGDTEGMQHLATYLPTLADIDRARAFEGDQVGDVPSREGGKGGPPTWRQTS